MISHITGTIKAIHDQVVTVDIDLLAFDVNVPNAAIFQVGTKTALYTHMHWNMEQGPSLYGFSTELERAVFLLIIDCSGIGPRIGLAVLAQIGPKSFLEAINSSNEEVLSQVSGIGAKKAEQIVVQLKHKVAKFLKSGVELGDECVFTKNWSTVVEALTSLHYTRTEIAGAMKYVSEHCDANNNGSFDVLMRQALTFLARK